jgi:hypothetical protein
VGSGGSAACANEPAVVSFITDDGVKLEADDYPTGEGLGASVVLLHMIPPANDRKNYPQTFIDALVEKKIRVLNVDRRGRGGRRKVWLKARTSGRAASSTPRQQRNTC